MYGLPRRPAVPVRRAFNPNYAPRSEDLVCWYDAGVEAYADDAGTVLATPGGKVALLKDQSAYGRHMRQASDGVRGVSGVDSGFPAISFASNAFMQTAEGFTTGMSFAVFRSLTPTWNQYGAVIGRINSPTGGTYRFQSGNAWLNSFYSSGRVRKNGIAAASSFGTINQIWLLTIDHLPVTPATAHQLSAECSSNAQYLGTAFCEALVYGSALPLGDVEAIEAMLMQKYGISG